MKEGGDRDKRPSAREASIRWSVRQDDNENNANDNALRTIMSFENPHNNIIYIHAWFKNIRVVAS